MPTHPAYLRQRVVLEYVRRGGVVPFTELQRHVENQLFSQDAGRTYSLKTFQRDRLHIIEKFGATIETRRGQGYYVADENPLADAGRQRLDELAHLHELLQLPEALRPYVQPETRRAQGLQHLGPLLRAAQGRRVVEFEYQKYWEDEAGTRTAGPLLLKEFRGRWYVLAVMAWSGRLACFGLDRISNLRETGEAFGPPIGFDPEAYYADAFGITRPHNEEPQNVVLRFKAQQGRYVLGYPLHHSQRMLADDGRHLQLALRVYLTHELYMELLSYGDSVEVLEPASLRDWLRQGHRKAARYTLHAGKHVVPFQRQLG